MSIPSTLTLLVVDDEHHLAETTRAGLQLALGLPAGRTRAATTPADALACLAEVGHGAPLVVVSDFNLKADRTGLDVLRAASDAHPGAILVLMTADDPHTFDAVRPALDALVEKPFWIVDVAAQVRALLDDRTRRVLVPHARRELLAAASAPRRPLYDARRALAQPEGELS